MSDTHSSSGPFISPTQAITPAPSTEEAVVIVAAMEALWPRAVISAGIHPIDFVALQRQMVGASAHSTPRATVNRCLTRA
jgi:hypothetical protein